MSLSDRDNVMSLRQRYVPQICDANAPVDCGTRSHDSCKIAQQVLKESCALGPTWLCFYIQLLSILLFIWLYLYYSYYYCVVVFFLICVSSSVILLGCFSLWGGGVYLWHPPNPLNLWCQSPCGLWYMIAWFVQDRKAGSKRKLHSWPHVIVLNINLRSVVLFIWSFI